MDFGKLGIILIWPLSYIWQNSFYLNWSILEKKIQVPTVVKMCVVVWYLALLLVCLCFADVIWY